jgi:hypothetical protein
MVENRPDIGRKATKSGFFSGGANLRKRVEGPANLQLD